jgi:hypothetical protein
MCIVEHERSTVVCDVAIGRVRQELASAFELDVTYTVVEGRGTRVQAASTVDAQRFTEVVQRAIAAAQATGQDTGQA